MRLAYVSLPTRLVFLTLIHGLGINLWQRYTVIELYLESREIPVKFEWDEAKNRLNIQKHYIDFQDAIDLFNHPLLTLEDNREAYGEARWVAIGWMKSCVGIITYTERENQVFRIISARKATKQEVRYYEENIHFY